MVNLAFWIMLTAFAVIMIPAFAKAQTYDAQYYYQQQQNANQQQQIMNQLQQTQQRYNQQITTQNGNYCYNCNGQY